MRVCINARLASGTAGGVEQVVLGLAQALSKLEDSDDEYLFLTDPADDWLQPHLRGPCRALPARTRAARGRLQRSKQLLSNRCGRIGRDINTVRAAWSARRPLPSLPMSDGTIEKASVDVVHFPFQAAFLTDIPSIYHPHDLQHLHLPELFSAQTVKLREHLYRAYCSQADQVVMMSSWGRNDIINQYGLAPEHVAVIPWGPVLAPLSECPEEILSALLLPRTFMFYPAQTFQHKNHLKLLEALSLVKQRTGLTVPLVCCGYQNDFFPVIGRRVRELDLTDQVRFLGFRTPSEVRALYAKARTFVFPSRFEGWGMPLCEAFASDTPAACSTATCLPAIAGDAALLFDPEDREEMARSIATLWQDAELRESLIERGRRRAELFTLERAARNFRALYRSVAGNLLSAEDAKLLDGPPLV